MANSFDCDDADPFVNPGASEACDGIDNDCDGAVDEGGDLCVSSDPCFTASCDGAGGCLFDPNPGGLCSDADACTTGDTCDAVGACIGLPVTCPADASCQPLLGGACVCDDSSATLCAGGCFDLLSDTLHCGDCDTACGPGQSCESGQCTAPPAPFLLDSGAAASSTIGPAGGELHVVSGGLAVRLVVPTDALLEDTLITATPISSFPLDGFSSGVHLEPEGQGFFKPIQLRITGTVDFAFGYDDQALDVHLRPSLVDATGPIIETVIELWHFSGAGGGGGTTPATSPSSPESQALDAMARGDAARALAPLTAMWAEVEAASAQAATDRSAFDLAAAAFSVWRGLVEQAGFDAEFGAELAEGESALVAGLVAERDRILAAATSSGDWRVLLGLETWLLPRAEAMGLANDGSPVSSATLSAMLPMTVSLSGVSLTLTSGGQRYHLVGQASASLAGGPAITDPPVEIDATVFGTVEVTFEGVAAGGSFDLQVTQSREQLSANVLGSFSGFSILSVTDSATASADNAAELAILVTANPATFDVGDVSNIEASVARGFGPLGLAGAVTFSLTGDSLGCTLGAPGGTPDGDGKVLTTVSCDQPRVFALEASISHRGETATDSESLEARGGLVGTYIGTNLEYDYGDCNSCVPRDTRIVIEDDPVNGLTLYYCDSGSAATGWCTGLSQPWTMKYSITDEGGGVVTGVGSRPGAPIYDGQLQLDANLSGTTLTGSAFWQPGCPGGCYDAFEVTRVP